MTHFLNLLTSLCVLYFMTNFLLSWRIFDVMTSFLSSWHFVHHFRSKILWKRVFYVIDIMIYFWLYDKLLACFWCHDKLNGEPFVIMSCFWHHDELFDVMASFLTSWYVFDIMANFLLLICLHHDMFLTS